MPNGNNTANRQKSGFDWENAWQEIRQQYMPKKPVNTSPKQEKAPQPIPYTRRAPISEQHREATKRMTMDFIRDHLPTALDTAGKYYQFVGKLGYSAVSVPQYEKVESITLEGEKLCINEIPEDQEDNDIKPEVE